MIKNERQYRITKAEIDRFQTALDELASDTSTSTKQSALLQKARRDALRSQLEDLQEQVNEYDALRSGVHNVVEVESFDELPSALIRARISAGLSQKELAERLGMKEQQVQRYEATDYAGASFARLAEVVRALGVGIREDILVPTQATSLASFLGRLEDLGLDRTFVLNRFLPDDFDPSATGNLSPASLANLILRVSSAVRRVFGWNMADILGPAQPAMDLAVAAAARFKLPVNVNDRRLGAYTIYAHHLARLAIEGTRPIKPLDIPRNPTEVVATIRERFGEISLLTALQYAWSLGITVLPLRDSGAFHGAYWRIKGRSVIILKQKTRSEARWLFDLMHEIWHAGEEPELLERSVLEGPETDPDRRNSSEERKASQFAGAVVLNGRAEELVKTVVAEAGGDIPRLKSVLPNVANRQGISTASLANYMAFRLSLQGENWWGTANNLQVPGHPWAIARDVFLTHSDLSRLNAVDRRLIIQALSEQKEEAA